ncbi:UrcA family protein [Woodsholea maritima]|uniref:UrcA family protein n=1 Tax=Woodsholea maritima TaxID=240237 RepID=UPI00037AB825|nr:UrcA family protein [Woodsholea maritima]
MKMIVSLALASVLAVATSSVSMAVPPRDHDDEVGSVEIWFNTDDYSDPQKIQEIEAYIRSASVDVCTPREDQPRRSSYEITQCAQLAELQALALFHARLDAHQNSSRELLSTVSEAEDEASSVEVWFDRAALDDPDQYAGVEARIRAAAARVCAPEENYRYVERRTSHARCTRLATSQALAVLQARADAMANDERELLPETHNE